LSPYDLKCSSLPFDYGKSAEHASFCETHNDLKSCVGRDLSLRVSPRAVQRSLQAAV
jgi:hypothetical protein